MRKPPNPNEGVPLSPDCERVLLLLYELFVAPPQPSSISAVKYRSYPPRSIAVVPLVFIHALLESERELGEPILNVQTTVSILESYGLVSTLDGSGGWGVSWVRHCRTITILEDGLSWLNIYIDGQFRPHGISWNIGEQGPIHSLTSLGKQTADQLWSNHGVPRKPAIPDSVRDAIDEFSGTIAAMWGNEAKRHAAGAANRRRQRPETIAVFDAARQPLILQLIESGQRLVAELKKNHSASDAVEQFINSKSLAQINLDSVYPLWLHALRQIQAIRWMGLTALRRGRTPTSNGNADDQLVARQRASGLTEKEFEAQSGEKRGAVKLAKDRLRKRVN